MKLTTLPSLLFSLGVSFLAGAIGSVFTTQALPTWYTTIDKPPLLPPSWLFAPIWTVLYVCMGIALYLIITASRQAHEKRMAYWLFGVQLVLNTLWSVAFFGWHMLWASSLLIVSLVILLVHIIRFFRPLSKPASYLMLPYLVWICFASYLTIGVVLLN